MSRRFLSQQFWIWIWLAGSVIPVVSQAEIDFFQTPAEQNSSIPKKASESPRGSKLAKVLFFIAPGCSACPEEAAKLESELSRLGLKYKIEGVFVGDPPQVGKYLACIGTYPFKFDLALDVDGKMTRQHGVKSFPSAVVDVDGRKFIITKASELEAKLR